MRRHDFEFEDVVQGLHKARDFWVKNFRNSLNVVINTVDAWIGRD